MPVTHVWKAKLFASEFAMTDQDQTQKTTKLSTLWGRVFLIKNVSHTYKQQWKQNALLVRRYLAGVQAFTFSFGEFDSQERQESLVQPWPCGIYSAYLWSLRILNALNVFLNLNQTQRFISRLSGNIIVVLPFFRKLWKMKGHIADLKKKVCFKVHLLINCITSFLKYRD